MKAFALTSISILLVSLLSIGQNRISSWDTDKITTIKIETKSDGELDKSVFFSDKKQMDKILDFLKAIDFKETNEENIKNQFTAEDWTTRFIFRGQRDWVLFYENSATIGKTSFWINKDLNKKVKKLVVELEKNKNIFSFYNYFIQITRNSIINIIVKSK